MTTGQVLITLLFTVLWLPSLAGHFVLLKILLTPNERAKLRLPASAWLPLFSITVADLAALLLGLPFTAFFEIFDEWYFGGLLCRVTPFVKTASMTVSAFGILTLMMQCYEIACKSSRPKTPQVKEIVLVALIWLVALITASPMIVAHTVGVHKGSTHEDLEMFMFEDELERSQNRQQRVPNATLVERQVCYIKRNYSEIYSYCIFLEKVVQFAVPFVIVIYLFIKTADSLNHKAVAAKAKAQQNRTAAEEAIAESGFSQQPSSTQQLQIPKNSVKFVRMILVLALVFFLIRTPAMFFDIFIVYYFESLWHYYTVFAEATYFIKPLVLFAVNTNFQHALRTLGVSTTHAEDNSDGQQVDFCKLEEDPVTP